MRCLGQEMTWSNERPALNAGRARSFHLWRYWPGASEAGNMRAASMSAALFLALTGAELIRNVR